MDYGLLCAQLRALAEAYAAYEKAEADLEGAKELMNDPEMRELLCLLSKCVTGKRVWQVNHHSPYYSANRYRRVA